MKTGQRMLSFRLYSSTILQSQKILSVRSNCRTVLKVKRLRTSAVQMPEPSEASIYQRASQSTFVSRPNPVTGKMDWIQQDEDYDFQQEIARSGYGDMLHDTDRNKKYFAAIRAAVELLKSQGKPVRVLDIGTGTGLLSMMAVQAGADTVTACEAFPPMADCARKVIATNNMDTKIRLVPKRSTDVILGEDMSERANLLVTELFDTELIGEAAIISYTDAHKRLMEADCVAVPTLGRVFIQAVQCDQLRHFNALRPIPLAGDRTLCVPEGFTQCSGAPSLHDLQVDELEEKLTLVSDPVQVFSFDFSQRDALPSEGHCKVRLTSQVDGQVDAFVMWWDLQMDPQAEVWLSCGPRWTRPSHLPVPWRDHWMQAVYYPGRPVPVKQQQDFDVFCNHDEFSLWFDTVNSHQRERPVCTCGLHVTFSRSRLSGMTDQPAISTYTSALQQHLTASSVCLVISEGSLLPLIAAALGAKKVFYLDTNLASRRIIEKLLTENKMLDQVKILEKEPENITPQDLDFTQPDVVIAEPYTMAAHLPWEHVYFWYALSALRPHLSPNCVILPKAMKVKAMALHFRDLHKIRAPVGVCEGFDITQFDQLIQSSSDTTDPDIEPQPLWEYPSRALSAPTQVASLDFTTWVSDMKVEERTVDLVCSRSGPLNGVALWTEFDFGSGLGLNHGVEDWQGEKVRWDMCSRQGVHLLRESLSVEEGSCVKIDSKFDPSVGEMTFSFDQKVKSCEKEDTE